MKKQYIVLPKDKKERKDFYNYLMNNGYFDLEDYLEERYINSHFPFVIESDKSFWLCESVTCCACASQNKQIISCEEFLKKC